MKPYDAHKTALQKALAEVTVSLEELGARDPNVPEDWVTTPGETVDTEPDENVAADRVEEWDERRGELSALETRYNNIRRALKKIDAGTYGTCEVCGAAIAPARLDANPAARTCHEHFSNEAELPN